MAWQLHYTSARSGPTGRAGFQFVAETPGLPPQVRDSVAPFLTYRPPPEAPLSPAGPELAAFPVAFAYDLLDGRPLLVRARYLGRDYSGRQGNFLAHAVVAEPAELEGLRPAELWESGLWADEPGAGDLAGPVDLVPGAGSDPESLGEWLAASAPGSYELLARLVDAIVPVLERGHGRVVLVGDETGPIARWIAVVSYSLPLAVTARLSFVTYSADPGAAHHRVVGTTPEAWSAAHRDSAAAVVDVRPGARPPAGPAPGRFARTVAGCWRDGDLAGLDALAELALADPGAALDVALDRAAALLALCRDDPGVTPAEESAAARLLARHGGALPDWVWYDLVPGLPRMGFDLALAIWSWARRTGDGEVVDRCGTRCALLGLGDPSLRARARAEVPRLGLSADAAAELGPAVTEALNAAGDLTEVAGIGVLAAEIGVAVPAGEVRSAAAGRARAGAADLPAALAVLPAPGAGTPPAGDWPDALVAGAVAGLAAADEETRDRTLTAAACDALYERPGPAWDPVVGRRVLDSVGRRRPDRRLAVTAALLRLDGDAENDRVLRAIWTAPPTVAECADLLTACAPDLARHPCLTELPSRAFAALTGPDLAAPATLRLAERVRALLAPHPDDANPHPTEPAPTTPDTASGPTPPAETDDARGTGPDRAAQGTASRPTPPAGADDTRADRPGPAGADDARAAGPGRAAAPDTAAGPVRTAVRDAGAVLAGAVALEDPRPERVAEVLGGLGGASPGLAEGLWAAVADGLAGRSARFQAEVLAAAAAPVRARLTGCWLRDRPGRGWGAGRGAAAERRNRLVEVALRLRLLGGSDPRLDDWAREAAGGRLAHRQLDAHLRDRPELRDALRDLSGEGRGD